MKQSTYGVIILSAAVVLLAALGIRAFLAPASRIPAQYADAITEHANGDFVYQLDPGAIAFDESQQTIYVQNLLIVYTVSELSDREKQALADAVDGTLMASEQVLYASHELPMAFDTSEADDNPWTNLDLFVGPEDDRGNETSPGGNDWWAEAVGAYTAWSYGDLFHDVTAGVFDNGVNLDHEDLSGNAIPLPGYPNNSPDEHGTGVAAMIGAKNNTVGLRGLACGSDNKVTLVCADWSPVTNDNDTARKDFICYMDTGEAIEVMKQMVEADVRVINNSWGLSTITYWEYLFDGMNPQNWKPDTIWSENYVREYSIPYLLMILQMLSQAQTDDTDLQNHGEVLFVQSAGNDTRDCWYDAAFCAIDQELWDRVVGADTWQGISYEDVRQHILIVASVDNVRNDSGDYQISFFSNYGDNVDLCAPGAEIFTAGEYAYHITQGTSLAAPIVAGSAAVLWAIDPSLTVPEVWSLLCDNTAHSSYPIEDNPGAYPMVNIGLAVEALLSQRTPDRACVVRAVDSHTGEPVENAVVTLLDMDGYTIDFDGGAPEEDLASQYYLADAATDSDGTAVFYDYPNDAYPACIRADGYEPWYGWVDCTIYYLENGLPEGTTAMLLREGEGSEDSGSGSEGGGSGGNEGGNEGGSSQSAQELLLAQLDTLAGQYGVIATGNEEYLTDMLQSTNWEIPAQRLTGLLGADIKDYDNDGQPELLTIRLDFQSAKDAGNWAPVTHYYISVYEAAPDLSGASMSAQQCVTIEGLGAMTSSVSNAVHFASVSRSNDRTVLYMDAYYNSSGEYYGIVSFVYDGTNLTPINGLLVSESIFDLDFYSFQDSSALEKFLPPVSMGNTGSAISQFQGWLRNEGVEEMKAETDWLSRDNGWRNPDKDTEVFLEFFKKTYDSKLESLGLIDQAPRGDALNPDRWSFDFETWEPYGGNYYQDCLLRPAQHYRSTNSPFLKELLTELCGVSAPLTNSPDAPTGPHSLNCIRLECYDETGLLDAYR